MKIVIYILYLINECWRFPTNRYRKNSWFYFNRDFIKIYHQSGANVDAENSQIKFYFGENDNFIQVGNGYLDFDIRVRRADGNAFTIVAPGNDVISIVNNAFAYTIHDARISTSAVEIEK